MAAAVLDRWRGLGQPYLCGAAAYRLLVAPDIDIEVFGTLDIAAGFAIVADLATDPAVRKATFINAVGEDDAGLGWEVIYRDHDTRWHPQMWLLPHDYDGPRSCDLATAMRAVVDPARRCAILRIKEDLLHRGLSYRSIDIYRAVLDFGVTTPTQYDRWAKTHSSAGLIDWTPAPP